MFGLLALATPTDLTTLTRSDLETHPRGDQTTLPRLVSETLPGATASARDRVFLRQNEFGIRLELDGILLPEQPSNALAEPISPRVLEQIDALSWAL